MKRSKAWYFSLSNPLGPQQADVPDLLRRLADNLESQRPIEVLGLTFSIDLDPEANDWPKFTVYYLPLSATEITSAVPARPN